MAKLRKDEIVTIHVLKEKGESNRAVARRLDLSEGKPITRHYRIASVAVCVLLHRPLPARYRGRSEP